jgi:hypothetical protein
MATKNWHFYFEFVRFKNSHKGPPLGMNSEFVIGLDKQCGASPPVTKPYS